jgi:hypothetical protein
LTGFPGCGNIPAVSKPTLRQLRVKALLQARELAIIADVSYDTLHRAEQGGKVSDLAREKLAQALGVGSEDIEWGVAS